MIRRNVIHNTKIIPLGGVETIGINCTVYEYGRDILVVDMGLGFPDNSYYGIDYVVPDISYLKKKKNEIRGIFITHAHLDHIGALPFLIPDLDYPDIYGSEFTIEIIKAKLLDKKIDINKIKFVVVNNKSKIKLGNFNLEFFGVTHSIPQCLGAYIKTPSAKIVHTGDFKFDNSPVNEPMPDYTKLALIGEEGIDLLLADSTNSLKKGYPISESDVEEGLKSVIERAEGRVIVGMFAGLVGRLYQIFHIAHKNNRKVVVAGYSMNQTLEIAERIGYIKIPKGILIRPSDVNKFPDNQILILSTGAQGEENAGLYKMADQDYKGIKVKEGDSIIISANTIVGNGKAIQILKDKLTRRGAIVHQSDDIDLFTSGHGYQEDQKIMLNLIKPKHFMPVHGYQYFLRAHGETARQVGVKKENIIIAGNGSIIEGNSNAGFKITKQFNCEPLLVSGSGVGDIGQVVLKEREQLANYGIVLINISINKETLKPLTDPFIATRGFVYVKKNYELIEEISKIAKQTFFDNLKSLDDIPKTRDEIIKATSSFILRETEREPIILVIINYF